MTKLLTIIINSCESCPLYVNTNRCAIVKSLPLDETVKPLSLRQIPNYPNIPEWCQLADRPDYRERNAAEDITGGPGPR